ncbi:hypothetical protein C8J56DRAFT_336647 [Mycena floridula]|nr:hypothetical protein C8J56DRAFT_336647 [Mycena floridula]
MLSDVNLIVLVFWLVSLTATLAIAIPLTGILIRVRANFVPKRLQLTTEDGEEAVPGIVNSYFGILKRVYRIEGWGGLYKGFWSYLILGLLVIIIGAASQSPPHEPVALEDRLCTVGKNIIYAVLLLPANVLIYRSVVTPYKLSSWAYWRQNLHILFSPAERKGIWRIYMIPGLVVAIVCEVVLANIGIVPLFAYINAAPPTEIHIFLQGVAMILVVVLTTMALTPVEVVFAKLATQRHPAREEITEDPEFVMAVKYASDGEEIIETRHEQEPYTSFIHCFTIVINEEGWQELYRVWWAVTLGSMVTLAAFIAQSSMLPEWLSLY